MLFSLFNLSANPLFNLLFILIYLMVVVVSLTVHEWAHAWVALKRGDPTAKLDGRLTLNPLAHLDPLGTVSLLIFGFGWGKPVPVNEYNLTRPKSDGALVSLAGPVSNFLFAFLLALLVRLLPLGSVLGGLFYSFFLILIQVNLALAIFNLLPLYPLDGFRVVLGFLPYSLASQWSQMARFGPYLALFLAFTGILGRIISVPIAWLVSIFLH
ncbi:site-2 protease family protein [candidate division WWE3 bacterium CG08_land_8_20_14_0_20_43_13]|uniref:Site-2 protease family protein n=1 Tax=candidate division WWE3 bacterium CG08_land_8_20_14_0_20_43_13 TaxID=1975087 RepID=A0A2H0X6Y9_UNCKA|nr:MAG: site-2 protease family protein [candidate division WWE3 bacterium CG08_land_8_20_14_0_20_43_13]